MNDIMNSVIQKSEYIKTVIQRTIISVQKYKQYDIINANELNICLKGLATCFKIIQNLTGMKEKLQYELDKSQQYVINELQRITTELSTIIKTYGTQQFDDLINISLGNDILQDIENDTDLTLKYKIIAKYVHPISYKFISWKHAHNKSNNTQQPINKNRIIEDFTIVDSAQNLDCFDLARTSQSFFTKVYGIKIAVPSQTHKKTLIICGLVDDIMSSCISSEFITQKLSSIKKNCADKAEFKQEGFGRFLSCLTIKELLIYNEAELQDKYIGYMNSLQLLKHKSISQITTEFLTDELYNQRTTIIKLLLQPNNYEHEYLAYLLYDLLTNDNNSNVDTHEQVMLFDSFPYNIKQYFRDAIKHTANYTNRLSNISSNNIPLEQQICLMKASDSIKEKAMIKLKEIKSKSDDSGSKARHYLEGLLRIPFNIYKEEAILRVMKICTDSFNKAMEKIANNSVPLTQFPVKESYSNMEVIQYTPLLNNEYLKTIHVKIIEHIKKVLTSGKRNDYINTICTINLFIKDKNIQYAKLCYSAKKNEYMRQVIINFVDFIADNIDLLISFNDTCVLNNLQNHVIDNTLVNSLSTILSAVENVKMSTSKVKTYMKNTSEILDNAVYGHDKAKRQIERIIAQWINGEKSGYSFGFEGPPGVGKTSLAKSGIAKCLLDDNDECRPYAFIALGGKENGSVLDGHNYTYVGSTWGQIVDILMKTKCMNPIIFIDELDKVSRTEHGKEIIGILTHLIDSTQNMLWQDKYFAGVELDLSKALFIFSYNDVEAIDRVLLDRIHRVRFSHLSVEEKAVVTNKFLLPEIYKKMGLVDSIIIHDDIIQFIIEEYTNEPGVRKLKELLFEIIGEINLSVLKDHTTYELPIVVTKDDIKYKYLKQKPHARFHKIHQVSKIGVINGLWANALGKGGVLPIETAYYPTGTFFELKLTGMQGDVMKESMSVAKTIAWAQAVKINGIKTTENKIKEIKATNLQGIHIHCPEGATPKDGPSAGTAITVTIISLLTQKPIRYDIAITGEICLQGNVTAIGGLDLKILGGIRGGVKCFIFPKENEKEFNEFMEEYEDNKILEGIEFHMVETINEVLPLVFAE